MGGTLRKSVLVSPGNRIEISDPALPIGETVEVSVEIPEASARPHKSVWEFLQETPPPGVFKTAREVDDYLRAERESWGD